MNVVPQNGTALSGRKGKPGPFRNKKIACILGLFAGSPWEIFSRGGGYKLGQMGLDPGLLNFSISKLSERILRPTFDNFL